MVQFPPLSTSYRGLQTLAPLIVSASARSVIHSEFSVLSPSLGATDAVEQYPAPTLSFDSFMMWPGSHEGIHGDEN
jgi:hypothetical protein